jgi:hypothetical protein
MVRLGLQLTLRTGREAVVRLVLTALAVAIGVTVLLAVFAGYHAFQATSGRACWECTQAAPANAPASHLELWNYSENIYQGRFIEELDVAALGRDAPVVPGLTKLPGAGQFYASPALAGLLKTVPRDELGQRFPGTEVGTIGYQALSGPTELVAIVGYSPAKLASVPGTIKVDHISTAKDVQGTTGIYRLAFGIGAIIVLFPLLILINTATRLAAARREERFAAMRLVGATPRQVDLIATVEAVVGAVLGTLLGIGVFLALRSSLADISFSGQRFFLQTLTPTVLGYAVLIVGVPLAAAVASLWSLRRVRLSPLGVSRKVTPPAPTFWRLVPLLAGIPLFVVPLLGIRNTLNSNNPKISPLIFVGLLLIMAGLVMSGSWLTMQVARALGRTARGGSALLASRRLTDSPKTSFRAVSGLVLAVFVGSLLAAIAPVFTHAESTLGGSAASLTNVLRAPYDAGPGLQLPPARAATLLRELATYKGVSVVPIYANPSFSEQTAFGPPPPPPGGGSHRGQQSGQRPASATLQYDRNAQYDSIISCAALRQMPALGKCAPGVKAVYANANNDVLTDNPLDIDMPVVTPTNPAAPSNTAGLSVGTLLVKANDSATLEKARTLLTLFNATLPMSNGGGLTAWQMGQLEPETFGEVAQIRNDDVTNAEIVALALVGLTLLVAACSLAVTAAGSIVERKRPFTLLRLSGAPSPTLYRVILLESLLPLVTAALVAAATGIGVAVPLVKALPRLRNEPNLALPGPVYYVAMGIGLMVAVAVISSTLPVLARVTQPNNARFE